MPHNTPTDNRPYSLELVAADGRTRTETALISVGLSLAHTGVSGMDVELAAANLSEWTFGEATLCHGDDALLTIGVERAPGPSSSSTVRLSGRGPARALARGDVTFAADGADGHDAVSDAWAAIAPDWDVTVHPPPGDSEAVLSDFEASGTPLEVLQEVHDEADMRFVVQHGHGEQVVESFTPGTQVKRLDADVVSHESQLDVTGYANKVTVVGKADGGTPPTATVTDDAEINRLKSEWGVTEPIHWRATDPQKTTKAGCVSRAEAILADRTTNDTLSGTLEIAPKLVLPGYHYEIPQWSADPNDPITLPVERVDINPLADTTATVKVNAPGSLAKRAGQLARDVERTKRSL